MVQQFRVDVDHHTIKSRKVLHNSLELSLAFLEQTASMIPVAVALGQAHGLTTIHASEVSDWEIPATSASSLAGLVSEISQGRQGFRCGDYVLAARSPLELTQRLLF